MQADTTPTPLLSGTIPQSYETWFNQRIRPKRGGVYSERRRREIGRKYKLPIIAIGEVRLIIPDEGDAQLAKFARYRDEPEPQRPRRGRPRLINRG